MESKSLETVRHSAAHVIAQAVLRRYPSAKLGIGPVKSNGFYHDFLIEEFDEESGSEIPEGFLTEIETEAANIIEEELPFTQIFLGRDKAIDTLHSQGQIFKTEIINQIQDPELSFYKTGEEFIDLCRGPHLEHTGQIGGIKLTGWERVHWLGDPNRPRLIRINGAAFATRKELEEYETTREQIRARDHRIRALELGLIAKPATGINSPIFLDRGLRLRANIVKAFATRLQQKKFIQVEQEQIWAREVLDKMSTRLINSTHFLGSELGFVNNLEESVLELHTINKSKLDIGEPSKIYYESTQLTAENFSTQEFNLHKLGKSTRLETNSVVKKSEFERLLREQTGIMLQLYRAWLGSELRVIVRGSDEQLTQQATDLLIEYKVDVVKAKAPKGIAFSYELIYTDPLELEWRLASVEINDTNSKQDLHESLQIKPAGRGDHWIELKSQLVESVEALIALLIERYDGLFPQDIAPYVAVIIPESDRQLIYCENQAKRLTAAGIAVKINSDGRSFQDRIAAASASRINYILTVGSSEEENEVMSVKPSTGEDLGLMSVSEFLQKLGE